MERKMIFDKFKINKLQGKGIFNFSKNEENAFLFDFNTNTKIIFGSDDRICDISLDGDYVIITSKKMIADTRKRMLKIFNVKTQELVYETKNFLAYEALFSPLPNLIICRADIKNNTKSFIFDINTSEIVYAFPHHTHRENTRACDIIFPNGLYLTFL